MNGRAGQTSFRRPLDQAYRSRRIGPYNLLMELGAGGMGTVHVALKLGGGGFERLVVVKRVHRHLSMLPGTLEMQLDEARVASLIHHPNVASVIDVVEENRELSLVQEYHESVSLAALLQAAAKSGTPVSPAIVCRIVYDALSGLHAAHEALDLRGKPLDVIHRDVKPHNIIIGVNGTTKLIDFGISKAAFRLAATEDGVLKGSLPYLSPEQVLGIPLDRRTDLFSAGVVLYEALTGQPLVRERTGADTMAAILSTVPSPPSSLSSGIPRELDGVTLRALALERVDRFHTAAEFQSAIERAIDMASIADVARTVATLSRDELASRSAAIREALDRAAADEGGGADPVPLLDGALSDAALTSPRPSPEPIPRTPAWRDNSRIWMALFGLAVLAAAIPGARLLLRPVPAPQQPPVAAPAPVPQKASERQVELPPSREATAETPSKPIEAGESARPTLVPKKVAAQTALAPSRESVQVSPVSPISSAVVAYPAGRGHLHEE